MTVIVIGAGASGLSAAAELAKANVDYIILEARGRTGGRVNTVHPDGPDGPLVELGAAWFHEVPHNPFVALAQDNDVPAVYDDDDTVVFGAHGVIEGPALGAAAAAFGEFRKQHPETSLKQAYEQFEAAHPDEAVAAKALAQGSQLGSIDWSKLSSLPPPPPGRDMALPKGYTKILDIYSEPVDSRKIHLGEPVKKITYAANNVTVSTTKGEYKGSHVICTIPVAVLKKAHVAFDPPLSGAVAEAIADTSVADVGKVWLEFDRPFWPAHKKMLVSGDEPALVYNWHAVHKTNFIVGVLITKSVVEAVEKNPANAFEIIKPYLQKIAPGEEIPKPKWVVASSWGVDPFSEGAISTYEVGKDRDAAIKAFEKGLPGLSFAGEHATSAGTTFVHGAYLSGQRAAQQATN